MAQAGNKVEWCLRKAEKEMKESHRHRGLLKIKPDTEKAKDHINKAHRYLRATEYLKKGNLPDISTSTAFYSMYHSLLAIVLKHGYESRNQECTFAFVYYLIAEGRIDFEKEMLEKIASLEPKDDEKTSVRVRERFQYGTEFDVKEDLYKELVALAKNVIEKAKEIINN